jgi:hypothetical protein
LDSIEVLTEVEPTAEIIHAVVRRKNARRPSDIGFMLAAVIDEIKAHEKLCEEADFAFVEKGDISGAKELLSDVNEWLQEWRNHVSFAQSHIDTCMRNMSGTPRSDGTRPGFHGQTKESIARMLNQLAGDFEGWRMERTARGWHLVVMTKPITLHCTVTGLDVPLGRFMIKLSLNGLTRGLIRPYKVIPETRAYAFNDGNPHPHVRDDVLCEGNGEIGITNALNSGDLFAFFILIEQILNTYNASSPYVRLESFAEKFRRRRPEEALAQQRPNQLNRTPQYEFECEECGTGFDSDDTLYGCALCDRQVCESDQCSVWCEYGDSTICSQCVSRIYERGCPDCSGFATGDCAIRENIECDDCGGVMSARDAMYCDDGWLCHSCLLAKADSGHPCCDHPSVTCPLGLFLASHHPNHAYLSILRGTGQPEQPIAPAQPGAAGTGFAPAVNQENVEAMEQRPVDPLLEPLDLAGAVTARTIGMLDAQAEAREMRPIGMGEQTVAEAPATTADALRFVDRLINNQGPNFQPTPAGFHSANVGTSRPVEANWAPADEPNPPQPDQLLCIDCGERWDPALTYNCNGTVFCRACLESRITSNEPCCSRPVAGCAYGRVAFTFNPTAYRRLPDEPAPNAMGAVDVPLRPSVHGTGFGPPTSG